MKSFALKCLLGSAMAQADYWCNHDNLTTDWTQTNMQTLETTSVAAGSATDCKVLIEGWVEANGAGLYVCGEYYYDTFFETHVCGTYTEVANEAELRVTSDESLWGENHEAWAWDDLVEMDEIEESSAYVLTATVLTVASIAMASTI